MRRRRESSWLTWRDRGSEFLRLVADEACDAIHLEFGSADPGSIRDHWLVLVNGRLADVAWAPQEGAQALTVDIPEAGSSTDVTIEIRPLEPGRPVPLRITRFTLGRVEPP